MDYKEIYLSKYKPELIKQENCIKNQLTLLKNRNKSFQAANYKIDDTLRNNISSFKNDFIKSENNYFLFTFEDRDKLCTGTKDENLESILETDIFDLYIKHHGGDLYDSYEDFLLNLGEFKGLYDAKRFYEKIIPLVEILYNSEKINEIKLEEIENSEDHSTYNDLKENFVKVENISTNSDHPELATITKAEEDEIDLLIKKITSDEKILISSILMSMTTKDKGKIPDTELVRILYLTEGVFDKRIFIDKGKDLTYMGKFNKGIYYYENLRKRIKIIDSILDRTEDLKIDHFREYIEDNFQ